VRKIQGGDFFESIPSGCDVYVLKRLLPGFDDEGCLRVLRASRAAIPGPSE
jgi:hypothetical protein